MNNSAADLTTLKLLVVEFGNSGENFADIVQRFRQLDNRLEEMATLKGAGASSSPSSPASDLPQQLAALKVLPRRCRALILI